MISPWTVFEGEGESRAAARAVDWAATPLGTLASWSTSLRSTLGIVMNSRHPMFLWWGPELVQFYNDAYLPSFGRGKHPVAMGQRGVECWQEIWSIISPQIEDVMERGRASWNEDQLVPIHRNGRIEEVYWTYGYSPVYDDDGTIGGVLVVCTETTAVVLAMRRLDFVRRLATALNGAQDSEDVARISVTCLANAQHDVPFCVMAIDDVPPLYVGIDGAESTGLLDPRTTAAHVPITLPRGVACKSGPEPVTEAAVYPVEGASGGTLIFGLSPRLPFDDGYHHFLQQVVEQIANARVRIAIELERRRLLLQAPVAAALLTGPDHVFEIANPRYVEMVGREVLGKRYVDAFPEVRDTELPEILDRVYLEGEPFVTHEMRIPLLHADREEPKEHFFKFSLEPIRDVRGNVYGMMAVAVDITAQVAARVSLEHTNLERARLLEAASVASRAKDEFLAMLGHELRNPLAPILTALDVMKVKGVKGLDREREIIERQASHLVQLVDDLLDVARVAEGKIELKKRRVALQEIVAAAVETASPLLEKHQHELRLDVPPHGLDVDADPPRLVQVLANLLTNAARYTKSQGVITVKAWQSDANVVMRVEDNGIGLRAEQIPYLFERFFQGARSGEKVHEGLGLGLALVKGLVELHGGSVRAESAGPGKGSAFEVRLGLATAPAVSASQRVGDNAAEGSSTERVLLVDDSEDITELFSMFLRLSGFDVQTAFDGPSALRIAESYRPTVVILDLGLPVMDGYEIAAQLVQRLGPSAPRLVAMSGYGRQDDLEKTRRAGFETHLVKPVDSTTLLAAIARR